jgi:fructose-bisphosphate aldolase class II
MLANLKDILEPARQKKTCVGQFNVLTRGMARGVIDAAEEAKVPVVLGIEEDQLDICSMQDFAAFVLPMAENASVPVAVHFDHGFSVDRCAEALRLGFTSVNYDRSQDPLDQNEFAVAGLAHVAHAFGASVEAELGHTPTADEADGTYAYTVPEQAEEFVRKTKVDALAVAVGTAHGEYKTQPSLDYDRIKKVAEAVKIPLVLHGGSGLSDKTVREAIASGISKIDIFTDINLACFQGDIQAYNDGIRMKSQAIPYELHAVKVYAAEKIRLFAGL